MFQVPDEKKTELKKQLGQWRREFAHQSFVGEEALATNALLDEIVAISGELYTLEDLKAVKGVRPHLAASLWETIVRCVGPFKEVSPTPPPRRRRATMTTCTERALSVDVTRTLSTSRQPLSSIENRLDS